VYCGETTLLTQENLRNVLRWKLGNTRSRKMASDVFWHAGLLRESNTARHNRHWWYIAVPRTHLEETTSGYDREHLHTRLAKLVGGIAVIQVGAAEETPSRGGTIDACPGCGGIWLDKGAWEGRVGRKAYGWLQRLFAGLMASTHA